MVGSVILEMIAAVYLINEFLDRDEILGAALVDQHMTSHVGRPV